MNRLRTTILTAGAAAALALPAAAQASEVWVGANNSGLHFFAGDGETNDVRVWYDPLNPAGPAYVLRDNAHRLDEVKWSCHRGADDHTAVCPVPEQKVYVWTYDGDDHVALNVREGTVIGGAGNDHLYGGWGPTTLSDTQGVNVIHGGPNDDYIVAGTGRDTIHGHGGDDRIRAGQGGDLLYGGAGNDDIQGGEGEDRFHWDAGADDLIGGPAYDTVVYEDAPAGVSVSLDGVADDGPGENDQVVEMEAVFGSRFDDTLAAGDTPVRLVGRDGNDLLLGGAAPDELQGDAGDDTFDSLGGADDVLLCGSGTDTAHRDADVDYGLDCEDLTGEPRSARAPHGAGSGEEPRSPGHGEEPREPSGSQPWMQVRNASARIDRRNRARLRLRCTAPIACRGRVEIRVGARLLGARTVSIPAGSTLARRVRLADPYPGEVVWTLTPAPGAKHAFPSSGPLQLR